MVAAIEKCKEIVEDESQIILDIMVMYTADDESMILEKDLYRTVSFYNRFKSISTFHNIMANIDDFKKAYPTVNFRYLVNASKNPLPDIEILDFTPSHSARAMEQGWIDAKRVLGYGPGVSFDRALEDYHLQLSKMKGQKKESVKEERK